ncbi:MAG: BamA/TamA family outer membrane protein [Acidobacteriota bacterium]
MFEAMFKVSHNVVASRYWTLSLFIVASSALIVTSAGSSIAQQNGVSPLAPPAFCSTSATLSQAKQFRLGQLIITGNTHTKLFVILRMIPLTPGDIFNQSLWEFGLEQINRSGLFKPIQQNDVVMKPDDATGLVDVELHLKERDRQRIDMSGGAGTTGGASISLDYANTNLTGRGDRLIGRARIGTRERSGGVSFPSMSYGKLPISFDLSGFFERFEFVNANKLQQGREPLFVQRTAGGSIGAFLPLNRSRYTITATTRAGLVYSFTSTNLADALLLTTASVRSLEQGGLRIASLTPLLLHDTLDRELDPQRGERLALGAELGARALGGSLNTFKPYFDYRRFWALGNENDESREPTAIGFRIRASHIRSFGEPFLQQALSTVRGVPVFRRVFLGGETEVRGYDVNSIAPLARLERFVISDGNAPVFLSSEVRPVGGDTQVVFNAEYRVPIIWRLSTAAFFDIGTSFNARSLVKESFETMTRVQSTGAPLTVLTVLKPLKPGQDFLPRYRYSLGGELRLPIPVLNIPLRFIFAWNPNAQKQVPEGALLAPEKRFAFRVGFSRTL